MLGSCFFQTEGKKDGNERGRRSRQTTIGRADMYGSDSTNEIVRRAFGLSLYGRWDCLECDFSGDRALFG